MVGSKERRTNGFEVNLFDTLARGRTIELLAGCSAPSSTRHSSFLPLLGNVQRGREPTNINVWGPNESIGERRLRDREEERHNSPGFRVTTGCSVLRPNCCWLGRWLDACSSLGSVVASFDFAGPSGLEERIPKVRYFFPTRR